MASDAVSKLAVDRRRQVVDTGAKSEVRTLFRKARMNTVEADIFDRHVIESGCETPSEFIRQAIILNKNITRQMKAKTVKHPITLESLRLLSTMSNNTNQVARRLNEARRAGGVTDQNCMAALEQLKEINLQMHMLVSKAGGEQ